jgi:hypothetical protein
MGTKQGEVTITIAVYGPAEDVMKKFQVALENHLSTIY